MLRDLALVGLGGGAGSIARFVLGRAVQRLAGEEEFPLGTLAVNVLGCLVIGVLAGVAERGDTLTPESRVLLFTGVLGGFTTFSAFALETHVLGRTSLAAAAGNVLLHLVLGLGATWIGHRLAT